MIKSDKNAQKKCSIVVRTFTNVHAKCWNVLLCVVYINNKQPSIIAKVLKCCECQTTIKNKKKGEWDVLLKKQRHADKRKKTKKQKNNKKKEKNKQKKTKNNLTWTWFRKILCIMLKKRIRFWNKIIINNNIMLLTCVQ